MKQNIQVSDKLTPYEAYQLCWMLEHGYSLANLIQELTDCQFADPEDSDAISRPVSEIFENWEQDLGFGSEIWACEREFNEVEGAEEDNVPSLAPGDVCLYSFGKGNDSANIVEIVRLLKTSVAAEIRVLTVINDDSGNGYFTYLQKTGETMNASLEYLKKLDPEQRAALENTESEHQVFVHITEDGLVRVISNDKSTKVVLIDEETEDEEKLAEAAAQLNLLEPQINAGKLFCVMDI